MRFQLTITKSKEARFSAQFFCPRSMIDLLMPHKFSCVNRRIFKQEEGKGQSTQLTRSRIWLSDANMMLRIQCLFCRLLIQVSSMLGVGWVPPLLLFLIHKSTISIMAHGKYGMIWEYQDFGLILSQPMGRSQLSSLIHVRCLSCVLHPSVPHPSWGSMVWCGWDFGIIHPIQ